MPPSRHVFRRIRGLITRRIYLGFAAGRGSRRWLLSILKTVLETRAQIQPLRCGLLPTAPVNTIMSRRLEDLKENSGRWGRSERHPHVGKRAGYRSVHRRVGRKQMRELFN